MWDFLFAKLELVFLATYIAEVVFIGVRHGEKSGSSLTRQRRSCKVGISSYLYIVFIILFLRNYRIYGEIWFYSFMNSALNSQHLKTANIYSFWQLHLNFHKEAKLNMFGPSLILDFLKMDTHILFICYYYYYYYGFLNLACSCFPACSQLIFFFFITR